MKKLFLVSLLLTSAGVVHAETPHMVNADGSELSAICIAAVDSREAMYKKAAEVGEMPFEPSTLRCNGMTVSRFISSYRAATAVPKPEGFVFSKSDDSPTTALCLAAVKSEQEYMTVKEQYFGEEENIEAEVHCNGIPLLTFARKYRAPGPTLSLR
jgi:hypothetical protein